MGKIPKQLILFALLLTGSGAFAQDVQIDMEQGIQDELRMKNAKVDTTQLPGFRIQIHFGSDLNEAEASMSMFMAKFPQMRSQVYKLYQQPYWKIRVGNYYREIDAQEQLQQIRVHFADAFVVKDVIHTPPLPQPVPVLPDEEDEP